MAGPSGAGKSTLSLALARTGMSFLADDTVFLAPAPGGVNVLGFADEVDLTPGTLAMFGGDLAFSEQPVYTTREKWSLRLETAMPVHLESTCRATALLLVTVGHCEASTIEPADPAEALLDLAPNVLLTEQASAQRHLDALASLVGTVPVYRLRTGRDFAALGDRLAGLVAS